MNDKEMIEQMARIMCGHDCEECAKETADWRGVSLEEAKAEQCLIKKQAELLYNAGCRIIPEGSVVLSREEHQQYLAYKIIEPQIKGCFDRERELEHKCFAMAKEQEESCQEGYLDGYEKGKEQARKETAAQILNEQYQECKVAEKEVLIARGGNKNDDYYKGFSLGMTNTTMHIQELAKQFGVDLKGEE